MVFVKFELIVHVRGEGGIDLCLGFWNENAKNNSTRLHRCQLLSVMCGSWNRLNIAAREK